MSCGHRTCRAAPDQCPSRLNCGQQSGGLSPWHLPSLSTTVLRLPLPWGSSWSCFALASFFLSLSLILSWRGLPGVPGPSHCPEQEPPGVLGPVFSSGGLHGHPSAPSAEPPATPTPLLTSPSSDPSRALQTNVMLDEEHMPCLHLKSVSLPLCQSHREISSIAFAI